VVDKFAFLLQCEWAKLFEYAKLCSAYVGEGTRYNFMEWSKKKLINQIKGYMGKNQNLCDQKALDYKLEKQNSK